MPIGRADLRKSVSEKLPSPFLNPDAALHARRRRDVLRPALVGCVMWKLQRPLPESKSAIAPAGVPFPTERLRQPRLAADSDPVPVGRQPNLQPPSPKFGGWYRAPSEES